MEQSQTGTVSAALPTLFESPERAMTKEMRYRAEDLCRLAFLFSDSFAILGALVAGYYIRFDFLRRILPPGFILAPLGGKNLASYLPSMFLGAAILFLILFGIGAYESRVLLRFRRFFFLLLKSVLIWLIVFAGVSFILEFDAHLSRVYLIISSGLLVAFLGCSRFVVQRVAVKSGMTAVLRRQILFVDWTAKTWGIARAVMNDRWNPYEIVACAPNRKGRFTSQPPDGIPTLRSYHDISLLCERGLVDIVILADGRAEEDVLELARECEKKMVDFMVIPSGFQVLLSCLELNTISGVPLLGVTKLPLNNPFNWALKRAIDIVGSLAGLVVSAPIIALYALLVYLESPGPVFYRQLRVGRRGRHFHILKIRSMKLDAESASGPRWATRCDDRTLKIGAFMRRWNIDELPQFWNVLKGDLSLVGPRPERPELIKRFREEVLYYNARHNIIPGMTGWAQVNGFRGDTDLSERIRCDIYYIENWNPILDIQIMLMTFFRWEGAH